MELVSRQAIGIRQIGNSYDRSDKNYCLVPVA
jgi:hypothetical protein